MIKKIIFSLSISAFAFSIISAQQFINCDLEVANLTGSPMQLPDNWQNIPYTNANNVALFSGADSPDIVTTTTPTSTASLGYVGIPYSGNSFLVGGYKECFKGSCGPFNFLHEGIRQTVNGFIPGQTYDINFFQTIIQQTIGNFKNTGCWRVYVDNILIGTSTSSYTNLPATDINLNWDYRSIAFTATSSTHEIGLLPFRNVNDPLSSTDSLGTFYVMMALDSIYISTCNLSSLDLGNDTVLCEGATLNIASNILNTDYLWQDGSSNQNFEVSETGLYWVEASTPNISNCTRRDSIFVEFENCDLNISPPIKEAVILEIPNIFTPNQDHTNDIFKVSISKGITAMSTTIFNRWGQQLFKTDDLLINWTPAQEIPEGVYYYVIEYTDIEKDNKTLSGLFHLIR